MSEITKKEKHILNSYREILWLQRQIEEYEEEADPDMNLPETITEENMDENLAQYYKHITELRTELDNLAQLAQLKEKLVSNMDAQHFTLHALYPTQTTELSIVTEEKITERDYKVVEFLKLLEQFTDKKEELTKIQAELTRQHMKNKEIHKEIQELKESDISQVQDNHQALSQG